MLPDRVTLQPIDVALVAGLTDILFDLAGDQEVRVIEALAAVLARHWRDTPPEPHYGLSESNVGFASLIADDDLGTRREICRRIARRALRGSLVDPTRGATAVHRIDVSPAWARDRLPIGMFGPFLFYRLTPRQLQAWPDARGPSRGEAAGLGLTASSGNHADAAREMPIR